MKIDILTILPEILRGFLSASIIGRAEEKGLVRFNIVNLRDFTHDRHRTTDDKPYGGGSGMVMKPEPFFEAVDSLELKKNPGRLILPSPAGRPFNQDAAKELSLEKRLVFLCGHYEGIDARVAQGLNAEEFSIGDYIVTGGETAALVMIDAVVRLLPGALGDEKSAVYESFSNGLLEEPQYTRPAGFRGLNVPEVLLSGNHEQVRRWKEEQSLMLTAKRRPDLVKKRQKKGDTK